MIDARPPASDLADIRSHRLQVVEETRESLRTLHANRARMVDLVETMRRQIDTARLYRATVEVHPSVRPNALPPRPARSLSKRELRVLAEVAAGLSNKQIAVRLTISERTVRNHLTGIFSKLRVSNRTEAVLKAVRRGWLTV